MRRLFIALFIALPLLSSCDVNTETVTTASESTAAVSVKITESTKTSAQASVPDQTQGQETEQITLSFAGDCTLGQDADFVANTFDSYVKSRGYGYFFEKVSSVFKNDDFTFVNLEGPLTSSDNIMPKEFNFRGDADYVNILLEGGIDGVTLTNNHILDYGEEGFDETAEVLSSNHIYYTYFEHYFIIELKGIKIAYLGLKGWSHEERSKKILGETVQELRDEGVQYIIANYHWGTEKKYTPDVNQLRMAKYAVDCGVDLVIGHHPHVLEGIETYKGKTVVYSLGNFCFGGSTKPYDNDTIIYQQILNVQDHKIIGEESRIIPVKVSGTSDINNYQPVIAQGQEADRIIDKFEGLKVE
jgi:hypothetical protein